MEPETTSSEARETESAQLAFTDDGVDLTLIDWMLARTPDERLDAAQDLVDTVWGVAATG